MLLAFYMKGASTQPQSANVPRNTWHSFLRALGIERTRFIIIFSRVRAPRSAQSWCLGRSAGRKLFGAGFYRGVLGIRRYGGANSGVLPRDSPGFLLRILVDSSRVVGFLGFVDTTTTTPPTTKPTELRIYFLLAHCKRTYKKTTAPALLRSCVLRVGGATALLPYFLLLDREVPLLVGAELPNW